MGSCRTVVRVLALSIVFAVIALFVLTRPSERVLMHWTAPSGEAVLLYEGERDYGTLPFGSERRHYVYVGRDSVPSGYGHRVSFDLHPELGEPSLTLDAYSKRVRATFSDAGLEIEEPSGHRLFIPRRAYAGGR
jgi:hypothetical protein